MKLKKINIFKLYKYILVRTGYKEFYLLTDGFFVVLGQLTHSSPRFPQNNELGTTPFFISIGNRNQIVRTITNVKTTGNSNITSK